MNTNEWTPLQLVRKCKAVWTGPRYCWGFKEQAGDPTLYSIESTIPFLESCLPRRFSFTINFNFFCLVLLLFLQQVIQQILDGLKSRNEMVIRPFLIVFIPLEERSFLFYFSPKFCFDAFYLLTFNGYHTKTERQHTENSQEAVDLKLTLSKMYWIR